MKKILILAMGCNEEFFRVEEAMIREQCYAKHILAGVYENVDFWTYTASSDDQVHISRTNHKISVPCNDDIDHTWDKTRLTFQALDMIGLEYDYIFRTNLSTWINVPYLIHFVEAIPDKDADRIFSTMIQGVFNGSGPDVFSLYALGNSLLIPKKWIDIVKEADVESLRRYDRTVDAVCDCDKENSIYHVDDNAIGFIINVYCEQHGISPLDVWKGIKKCEHFDTKSILEHIHLDYIAVPFRMYYDDRKYEILFGKQMQDCADEFETFFDDETPEELYIRTTTPSLVTFARFRGSIDKDEFLTVNSVFAERAMKDLEKFDYSPEKLTQYFRDKNKKEMYNNQTKNSL
jgi:hypothetical protein